MTFSDENEERDMTGLQEGEGYGRGFAASGPNRSAPRAVPEVHEGQAVRRFGTGERPRAQRFQIHTPLRYRGAGGGEWRAGMIVNISESGMLFRTDQRLGANPEVEMRFSLSTGIRGEAAVQVVCRGVIARVVSEPGSMTVTALAARITKFHFVRPGRTAGV
ncbi:MAG: PilZ domain-containing protein [Candidatus Dormibacteraceae bacterium]